MKSKLLILTFFTIALALVVFFATRILGRTTVKVSVDEQQSVTLGTASDSGQISKVIPQSFPDDFPKIPGAEVQEAFQSAGTPTVIWVSTNEVSKTVAFYKDELPKAGWKFGQTKEVNGGTTFEATKGDLRAEVGIGKNQGDGQTIIFVAIQKITPTP